MLTERRDTRRFGPSEGRDDAILRHKGKADVALMLDVSAEGFRVCMHPGGTLKIGDVVKLETCDGQHVVRVAHLHDEEETKRVIVGLERIEDSPLVASNDSIREQIRRRGRFENDRIDIGPLVAYVLLPLTIGISILLLVTGQDGLRDITRMIAHQIGM